MRSIAVAAVLAGLFGSLAAAPASAAGDGFYAGVLGGFGGGVREGCTSANFGGTPPTTCNNGFFGPTAILNQVSGGLIGGQAGYDLMSGSFIYGVQGTGTFGSLAAPVDQWGGQIVFNALATLTGKAGMQFGNGAVIYGKAGLAVARAVYKVNSANCAFSQPYGGVTGGVGIEYPLNETFSIFGEANAYHFLNSSASCGSPAFPASYSNTTATLGAVMFGVNAHFN